MNQNENPDADDLKRDVENYLWKIGSRDEIHEMWDILKRRSRQLDEQMVVDFSIGESVEFDSRGEVHKGTISKVNQKTVEVKVDYVRWRVSPSVLRRC